MSAAANALRIALVGNPNSGKTALFNQLTGSRQKVANYAGVTVERKEGRLTGPSGRQYAVLDLAYLGGLMLDVAGLPKSAYFEANTRLRERCNGRFVDCPDQAAMESWRAHVFGQLHAFAE